MPPSVPHLSPPGPGGHWALTSQWVFCSSTNSSLHGPVPCVGWRTWPCLRAPGVSVCPKRLCFPLYPDGTPGPPESPGTRWSQGSPRGPESPAQPRWWVWGGSLEGNQRRAHQASPQAPALSPDLPDSHSVRLGVGVPSPSLRPGGGAREAARSSGTCAGSGRYHFHLRRKGRGWGWPRLGAGVGGARGGGRTPPGREGVVPGLQAREWRGQGCA